MAKIQPVQFPIVGTATDLEVTVLNFKTSDVRASTYYQLLNEDGKQCLAGNYQLTEEQFAAWGQDNSIVDDYVAEYLGVTIVSE
jgi:hypothetical protein